MPNSTSDKPGELGEVENVEASLRRLQLLATFSSALIALYVICAITFAIAGFIVLGTAMAPAQTTLTVYSLSAVATVVVFYVSALAIGMWIYRAHANLAQFGVTELEFTPGWSVGWFFVPFANLVKPYEAMRELWDRSFGDQLPAAPSLPLWWGCFLVGGIALTIGGMANRGSDDVTLILGLTGAGSIIRAASAVLLVRIIRQVTAAQSSMAVIGATFD